MKIIDAIWFTEMGSSKPIGIVFGETNIGEREAYIGTGEGFNQILDSIKIAKTGAKFHHTMLAQIVRYLKAAE